MLIGFLIYLFISAYIFITYYYFLTRKYREAYSFADRLLGTFILGISQIILTEMMLGFSLRLNSQNLLIFNFVISTCILVFSGVRRTEIARQYREVKYNLISFLALLIRHKVLLSVFILAFLQVAWWAFLVYLVPPYAWDDLFYHLPKVAYMLQSGGITDFQVYPLIWIDQFPFNSELLFLWNVIFPRNDILVNGSQIIFALFAVLAIYSLARKAGVGQQNAAWAVIFLFIPVVIQQATTCYIDIIMSALLIGAVNFMLMRDKPKINVLIVGMTIGIMLGSKYSYIGPCLIVSVTLWILILANIGKDDGENKVRRSKGKIAGEIALKLAIYLMPVMLLGGTWYIRNYLQFGNPVGPYQVEILGRVIFPGVLNPATQALPDPTLVSSFQINTVLKVWVERWAPIFAAPYYSYDGSRGFGPMFWILLIPSGVFAIILACKRRYWDYPVIFTVFGLCFLVIPFDWQSRYTIFVCGFGILSLTVILEYLKQSKVISLIAMPIIVLTLLQGNFQIDLTPRVISEYIQSSPEQRHSTYISWTKDYAELYQKLLGQKGVTILYSFVPYGFTYPLWDQGFTNKVLPIPANYTTGKILMDHIRQYGASYIITTEDSDIVKHYNIGRAKINLVYTKNNYWVFYYPAVGDDE